MVIPLPRAGWALAATVVAVCLPQAASASFIYGVADDNIIYEVNTSTQSSQPVFATGLTGLSNAFAYDTARQQFWFVDANRNLQLWNGGSALITVAPASTIGTTQPANAAYFNNSFWYFTDATATLNRIPLSYTDPLMSTAGVKETFTVSGITANTNTFGDIAINPEGILFGATVNGRFFTVDLNAANKTQITLLNPGTNPSLQLSFSADFTKLYGQNFAGGQWYTIDTATGIATVIPGFLEPIVGTTALRDLGGARALPMPGPLPVPGPMPLAGAAMGFAWSRRLRRRIRSGEFR